MNKKGYKIIDVRDGGTNIGGINIPALIVMANPIKEIGIMTSFSPQICDDTEYFFFPKEEEYIDEIMEIANSRNTWHPDDFDFENVSTRQNGTGKMIIAHHHEVLLLNFGIIINGEE